MVSTDRALRVALQFEFAELHAERIEVEQSS